MIKLKIIKINLYIPYIKNQTSKRKRIDQISGKLIDKIREFPDFKKFHDRFELEPSLKSYNKLVSFLRLTIKKLDKLLPGIPKLQLLLTDDIGGVIFNSRLPDDLKDTGLKDSNSFTNFCQGRIKFNSVFQVQASTMAEKTGTGIIVKHVPSNGKKIFVSVYVFKRTGSTVGFSIDGDEYITWDDIYYLLDLLQELNYYL